MDQRKAANVGFSLIEVMIVLIIIGILMMVALPGYQDSMRKSHRADGMRDMMELVARQERFYAQNSVYTDEIKAADGLNYSGGRHEVCTTAPAADTVVSSECHYTLSVEPFSQNGTQDSDFSRRYVLVAAPRGGQQKDPCGTLTVNSLGERSQRGSPGDSDLNCW